MMCTSCRVNNTISFIQFTECRKLVSGTIRVGAGVELGGEGALVAARGTEG